MKDQQALTFSTLLTGTTAATTARTANLDCQGTDYATIVVQVSAEANTNSTNVVASILESDDTVATNFATFDADLSSVTIDNTAAAIATFHVNRIGRKRYLRLSLTPDTTTNGAVIVSAVGITKPEVASSVAATTYVS